MKGSFITFEGIDGSGKSVQVLLLQNAFDILDIPSITTSEPDKYNPIGQLIRETMLSGLFDYTPAATALLFVADRAQHFDETIRPNLNSGSHVICDRYILSTIAYQYPKVPWEKLWELHHGIPYPDVTFYVDVPVNVAIQRINTRNSAAKSAVVDVFEDEKKLKKVQENYIRALESYKIDVNRGHFNRIFGLDGTKTPIEVHKQVLSWLVSANILTNEQLTILIEKAVAVYG
jgi:dTMP kinase